MCSGESEKRLVENSGPSLLAQPKKFLSSQCTYMTNINNGWQFIQIRKNITRNHDIISHHYITHFQTISYPYFHQPPQHLPNHLIPLILSPTQWKNTTILLMAEIPHQLRLVVYPIIYGFYTSNRWLFFRDFCTINSFSPTPTQTTRLCWKPSKNRRIPSWFEENLPIFAAASCVSWLSQYLLAAHTTGALFANNQESPGGSWVTHLKKKHIKLSNITYYCINFIYIISPQKNCVTKIKETKTSVGNYLKPDTLTSPRRFQNHVWPWL